MNPFTSKTAGATIMPGEWGSQQRQIDYERRLAEKLSENTEMPKGQTVSGIYVAPSWTQSLAQALNPLMARKRMESAEEKQRTLDDSRMNERQGTLQKFGELLAGKPETSAPYTPDTFDQEDAASMGNMQTVTPAAPGDRNAAMAELGKSRDPALQQLYMAQMLKGMEPAEPYTLTPGAQRFGPDNKPVASVAAKPDKPFIRTRTMGDQEVQEQLQADGSYQEIGRGPRFARQVAPVVNVGAEGKQGPIIQTDDGPMTVKNGVASPVIGPGGQPIKSKSTEKALPISAAGKLLENQQNLRRANQALLLIQGKNVDEATGDKNATGWKGLAPDFILQRTDPDGVATRAAINDLGSLVIHDRSGAAVTAAEFPRLKPFIPTSTDDPATVEKKLKRFVSEYQAVSDEAVEFYKGSGYKVPSEALRSGGDKQEEWVRDANGKLVRK